MKSALNRSFFWLIVICYFVAYYYQTPIQLSYILTFGITGSLLGVITSLSSFVSVMVIPIVPALTRKFGIKPVFLLGFVLQIIFFGLYWLVPHPAAIALANALNGVAFGITMVLLASTAVAIYPQEKSGAVISIYTMLQALAQAIATSLGIYVSNLTSYRGNYVVSTLLSVGCLAFCFLMSDLGQAEEKKSASSEGSKVGLKLLPLLGMCLFCGIIMNIVQAYIEPFSRYTGYTAGLEVYFMVFAGTMAVIRLFLAATIKKLNVKTAVLTLSPAVALGMLLMNIQQSAPVMLLSAALTAIGIGCLQTLVQYKVFQCYPPEERNKASSMFYFGFYGGMIVGSYSGSVLYTGAFKPSFFLFYAALSVIPAICALLFTRRKRAAAN